MKPRVRISLKDWVGIIGFFLVYFFTAKFGLSFDPINGFATLIWIPSGLSLAAILLYGPKLGISVFFGAFLVNLISGASLVASIAIGIGNTLESVFAWYLLTYSVPIRRHLDRLKDVVIFIVSAAFFSTMISASIGTLSLFSAGVIDLNEIDRMWFSWWIGDMLSVLVITSFIVVWFTPSPLGPYIKRLKTIVRAIIFIVFITLYSSVVLDTAPATYLLFPPIIIASLRYGQRGGTSTVLLYSVISILSTLVGYGPFTEGISLSENLLYLQGFMAVIAITSLTLAALDMERKELQLKKDEFMSVVSHELKTPLTSIKAFSQMLERKFKNRPDNQPLQYLQRMNVQLNKLDRLIRELLDVTRIQKGQFAFKKETIQLFDLIQETVNDVSITTRQKIDFNEYQKVAIIGDRDRLAQVFTNLLTNAIKYSPEKKHILIKLKVNTKHAVVSVHDFGKGIPKEQQIKIFDQFYQVGTDQQNDIGLGLGLYIARTIVLQHGGDIWVKSNVGRGSTFYVSFPLIQ